MNFNKRLLSTATPPSADKSVLKVRALDNGDAELLIYGFIGEDWLETSNSARAVVDELADINAATIQVRINSQGGSVPDGLAIFNALQRHPARIVITVDGHAESIASLIVQAGDERIMPENTMIMVHAPSSFVAGNAQTLRKYADVLDTWATAMSASYISKAPKKADEITAMLSDGADHYFTADEAVVFGLVDKVTRAADAEREPATAIAALLGYIAAIGKAPARASACLAKHIQSAATPQVFVSLTETTQRAVFAHIEDSTMRQKFQTIMAAAGGNEPNTGAAGDPTPNPAPSGEGNAAPAASNNTPAAAPAPAATPSGTPAPAPTAQGQDPIEVMAARNQRIRSVFANFRDVTGVRDLESTCLADPRMSVEAAQQQLLNRVGAQGEPLRPPGGGGSATGGDENQGMREAASTMLMARSGLLPQAQAEQARQGNPFLNSTLIDMSERFLMAGGQNTRQMTREQIATRVLSVQTTSDFPVFLSNTLHKMLLTGYAVIPFTWSRFCATGTLSDYRPHSRYHLSSFSGLKAVNEAGEYEQGVLGDGQAETIKGVRKGRILNITPEVLINDDLGAISRPVVALGQSAGRTIEKDVYAALALNAGMGPTMSDGKALFHIDHGNIASAAAAPTVASWDAARQQMGQQKDPGGNDYLDISPALWLGPLSLGTAARTINTSEFNPDSTSKYAPVNTSRGMVSDVIDTPRLSGTPWYMFANPAIEAVLEVAFLYGVQTPTIEQETNFKTDGLAWKVVHRYGVGGVGYRGAVRNAGA